jgi:hypothetical protein
MTLASNTQHKKKHKNRRKGKTKQTPKKGRQNIEKNRRKILRQSRLTRSYPLKRLYMKSFRIPQMLKF